MKLYYIVNARMPSEKAYGIQIAKMCEAFIEHGVELELCIPRTRRAHIPLQEFYGLRVPVPTRILAGLDWYGRGSIGFALSSMVFMASACFYLLRRKGSASLYTIDMDPYSFSPLALGAFGFSSAGAALTFCVRSRVKCRSIYCAPRAKATRSRATPW